MSQITFQIRDIAIAQPPFLSYMHTPRVRTCVNCGVLSSSFTRGYSSRLSSIRKLVQNPENANFSIVPVKLNPAKFVIKAVATLQPKLLVQNEDTKKNYERLPPILEPGDPKLNVASPSEDSEELNEREKLRRQRISKANKGNTPWNLGRKHSPETLQRIKERTRLAMQDPKVKKKLAHFGHTQSNETRIKIGLGVQMGWRRRREKLLVQETCFSDWQNLVAEAARQGHVDEEELQWDSFEKLNQQLKQEWLDSVEQRKIMGRPKSNKRAPKTLEQRRKIAASIAAKWADPEYRNRVYSGLAKYHGSSVGAERKRSAGEGQPRKRYPKKEIIDGDKFDALVVKTSIQQPKKSKGPMYKDPLAKAKFEMIKNIRARRPAADMKKHESLERAKVLVTEAEKAAKALEIAAASSPIAQASLIETRKLIAEAVQLIRSIETDQPAPVERNNFFIPIKHSDDTKVKKSPMEEDLIFGSHQVALNGSHNVELTKENVEDFDLIKLPFTDSEIEHGDDAKEQKSSMEGDQISQSHQISLNGSHNMQIAKSDVKDFDIIRLSFKDSESDREEDGNGKVLDMNEMPEFGTYKVNGTPELEAKINGGSIKINGSAKPNGALLQDSNPREEMPSTSVKKRWVRGRLVEVVERE